MLYFDNQLFICMPKNKVVDLIEFFSKSFYFIYIRAVM